MNAIQILKEWINGRDTQGMTLDELKVYYRKRLQEEPINVAQILDFKDRLTDEHSKKLYANLLEKVDERFIQSPPLRFNRILPLWDEYLDEKIQLMADMFDLFASHNLLNYGCLTRMMALPIISERKSDEQMFLCYCYVYSNYEAEDLNVLTGSQLFSPDYETICSLDLTLPDYNLAKSNIEDWFIEHEKYTGVILQTTYGC